ncbi:MAG: hypothetical protein KGH72_04175 [Candidatus Micrarchaeota archaeon]|nr:hypothetical protein [Candidatus Micrarchaeota archaeon]
MITGIEVTKIEASRMERDMISNMKFNINFEDVKIEKENVDVKFTFSAVYEGGANNAKTVGKLTITGNILSRENKKDSDEIESTWKSKKTLPIRFAEDIINMLNFECGARGTLVAYSIGFVAPLPITRAKLQDSGSSA